MALIWCGGEDLDFQSGTNLPSGGTSAGTYRPNFSRGSVVVGFGGNNPALGSAFAGGPITSAWLSAYVNMRINTATTPVLGLINSATGSGVCIGQGSAGNNLSIQKFTPSTVTNLATEAGFSLPAGSLLKLDLQLVNYGTSATVNAFVNGNLVVTFTGDVTETGTTNLTQVALFSLGNLCWFSEVIVSDSDTRTFSLMTMSPTGSGTTDQWTGSASDVNPLSINDANAVYSNTVGQDEQFALNAMASGVFAIEAVAVSARASSTSGATADKLALGVNVGGTVSVGAAQSLTTSFETKQEILAVNPVTSADWTQSDLTGIQVDLRSAP